ncbi:sugar phosphate isomerase/epimerase family protein [Caldanaerobacter subterraneus]|uniref:Sugar phosphate isomerase/epimerase n=1 Tax=Caldanaerobacter subterraneus subsp. pacificus DSM 12653 TaxID=391606 RepID=A0A0F5PKM2_9THEO|nr:sugar phosphate isomerase/epimerase family protein [Caldanaerobacter subterraneus]KKC29202.1 sugar phosphate isomerase/epimerase [Caldanaerobacter subterraneus subsp. pacificus DSM 12653]
MYIGFLTVALRDMPLKEKAKWASENGFKSLEVACWPKDNTRDYSGTDIDVETLTEEEAEEIKKYFKEYGLTISSLAYYDNNLDKDPEKRKFINNHLKKCIDAAKMLGTDMVGTFVGRNIEKSIKDNFDEFERVFTDIIAYAEDRGVKIIIENCPMEGWQVQGLPGTISFTPELWEEMFRRIPSPNFGLNLDPSHLVWQFIDYIEVIPEFKDRIFHVHAKDTEIFEDKLRRYGIFGRQLSPGMGYWRYRMPGMGKVDWERFIKTLKESGYDGVISIEHEDPVYEGSEEKVKEGLLLGLKHLRQFI